MLSEKEELLQSFPALCPGERYKLRGSNSTGGILAALNVFGKEHSHEHGVCVLPGRAELGHPTILPKHERGEQLLLVTRRRGSSASMGSVLSTGCLSCRKVNTGHEKGTAMKDLICSLSPAQGVQKKQPHS